jgi:hypothetical protein
MKMFEQILKSKPHQKLYLDRYIKFIIWCRNNPPTSKYIEAHHICPKASDLFPEYKSFKLYPWNKIKLTLKQHYIAHLLLAKAYGGSQSFAVLRMYRKRKKTDLFNGLLYEKLRIEDIEFNRISHQGDNHWSRQPGKIHNAKVNHPRGMAGKVHDNEYKKYMKEINTGDKNPFYGKNHSNETKKKLSIQTKSHRWITDGKNNIKLVDPDQEIPEGFRLGRTIKSPQDGKKWINQTGRERMINEMDDIPDGWFLGRAKRIFINNGQEMRMIFEGTTIPSGWNVGRVNRHTGQ